jgi:hypothetical protein
MFEKPQKAQVVRIKIEAVSLDSTSMAPSLDGPASGRSEKFATDRFWRLDRLRGHLSGYGRAGALLGV